MRISDWSSDVCSSDLQPVPEKAFDVDEAQPLYVHRVAADEVPQPLHPLRGTDQPARAAADDFVGLALGGRSAFRAMIGKDIGRPVFVGREIFKNLGNRSEEHTSELQSLMRISYAVFCLTKKNEIHKHKSTSTT